MWIELVATIAVIASGPSSDVAVFAQDPDPTNLPEIVVEGRTTEAQAREFIAEIAAPSQGAALARWRSSICIGAVNMGAGGGQYVVDRVSAAAAEVGLRVGSPGCSPNVLIIATAGGDQVARKLIEQQSRTIYPGASGFSRSRAVLDRFASSDRPVRWWHLTQPTDPRTGQRTVRLPSVDGRIQFFPGDAEESLLNLPQVTIVPTLLRATSRQDLTRAFIVIDFDQVDGLDFQQLADYVAFIALAQVDPEGDTAAFSTILNVFDDPASTPGLTAWDRAYLTGLYESDDAGVNAAARAAALRRDMVGVVRDGAASSDD